ncbi:hypothetical protein PC116_g8434 [Phytophthora cactorum]|nr:hypothetical protein Pcac1_g23188 [Phytophthora cactorum]KAG4243747.1 hypothetical protein PC116_g8434 [Phytophthora cactorum]
MSMNRVTQPVTSIAAWSVDSVTAKSVSCFVTPSVGRKFVPSANS